MKNPAMTPLEFPAVVLSAHDRIRRDIRRTVIERSESLSSLTGAQVFLKWEMDQVTGSFKLRGALNKLRSLVPEAKARGIVSASTGNHGLAMVHAARLEGAELILFLPKTVTAAKKRKLEAAGASLRIVGDECAQTEARAREFAAREGAVFVSPYNDPDIIAGQGTVGLEILADLPEAQDVLVPVGGGGLIGGIAGFVKSVRPSVRVHGVEPGASAFMGISVASGRLVDIEEQPTVADAVAGGIEPGSLTFPLCRDYVDSFLTVPEEAIIRAMSLLAAAHGRPVEGAGALAFAGVMGDPYRFRGRTVVCVVSGGNIDGDDFRKITGNP
jgi:threonine dehydratase